MFAMRSVLEKELDITVQEETEETKKLEQPNVKLQSLTTSTPKVGKFKKLLEVGIHTFIVLASQSVATILEKLYYDKGGNSIWLSSLTQTIGFPFLFPILWINKTPKEDFEIIRQNSNSPSIMVLLSIYVFLGFLLGGGCVLYSIGLLYLPASTYSLISASQLGFSVLFSLLLRLEKITPYVANSIFLLTVSSILLALQPDDDAGSSKLESSKGARRYHHLIGFTCTLIASAGYGLLFTTTELMFRKILKKNTLKEIMDVIICQSFFATCLILIGLFVSKDWKKLKAEMQNFELGKVSYTMIFCWTSLCWQLYTVSLLGLIMKVSALFANVITTFAEPLVPILSVIIFHDKMSSVKAISIVLAVWGFSSYAYQQYLDEQNHKAETLNSDGASEEIMLSESGLTYKENSTD